MKTRILIVDDEEPIADMIMYALETDGFEPLWAATGRECLDLLRREAISLAILDVGLPDGSGFDLFKEIRRRSDLPVLFLTARSEEIDRVLGLELGADDYVLKPFSPRELSARVKAILRRSGARASGPEINKSMPFEVDQARYSISYCGNALRLSRYEFKILQLLIERPGEVFSRARLMNLVWEEAEFSLERTVDTHIKTLRAKLKQIDNSVDPIQTHRGLGYSLREEW